MAPCSKGRSWTPRAAAKSGNRADWALVSPAPHTQLLVGGRIYSAGAPDATAMAVTDGTVVWVGQDRPGRALHPDAEIVDLHGAFVAPGFVDTHVHTTSHGLA